MTAVGFEPTPLRTGAWSQRLRPLGQTVLMHAVVHVWGAAGFLSGCVGGSVYNTWSHAGLNRGPCGYWPWAGGGATVSRRTGFATARLAQPAERKALNLVVVGSSPTVGVYALLFGGREARHGFCKHAPREARTPDLEVNSLTL
jgi:hypothetical protein